MFGFRDIETLRAVVRAEGFRAAAARTGTSQSAISNRVAALERRLGVKLFDRTGRGVRLTAAGRHLLDESARLIEGRDRLARELAGTEGLRGTVRIGVAETIVHTLLPALLGALGEAHPAVRFELTVDTSAELARRLGEDAVDVAVLLEDAVPGDAVREPLAPIEVGWYARAARPAPPAPLSLEDLARESIVTFPSTTTPYRRLERLFAGMDRPPPLHGSASLSTVRHLVAQGFGIGILPRAMVEPADATEGPRDVRPLAVCEAAVPPPLRFTVAWRDVPGLSTGAVVARAALVADRTAEDEPSGDRIDSETRSLDGTGDLLA